MITVSQNITVLHSYYINVLHGIHTLVHATVFCETGIPLKPYLLYVPLSLSRGDIVSSVLCCLRTDAADAGVISLTEELQTSQVDGTQRQTGGRVPATIQRVPVIAIIQHSFCCQFCHLHRY